jgi:hypothetical protein
VTARIEVPLPYTAQEIVVSSVRLQGTIPAILGQESIEDSDNDGIDELVVRFDRVLFQAALPQGEFVQVTVEGQVRDRTFIGTDTIRTLRPTVTHPHNVHLQPGSQTTITWTSPAGYTAPALVSENGAPVLKVLPNLDLVITDAARIAPNERTFLERIAAPQSQDVYRLSR